MTPSDFKQLLNRYQLGKASSEEVQRVETWYETLDNQSASPVSDQQARSRMWQRIDAQITDTPLARPMPVYRQTWFRAAAAVFLLIGLVGFGLWQWAGVHPERVQLMRVSMNSSQRPLLVTLDDGSQVTLEPGSFLRYPEHFAKARREVFLTGEAFFQVTRHPDQPFLVITDRVVTKVLGTSFRVKAYGGRANVSVTVRTGRVSVYSKPNTTDTDRELSSAVVLIPNQRAVFYPTDDRLVKTLAEEPVVLTPASERPSFDFTNTPLPEVFRRLETAYGVDFVYDAEALGSRTLTARLTNESLFEKLALISEVTHIHYEILDGQVIIDSRPTTTATPQ